MTADEWRQVEALYHAAAHRSADEQKQFLDDAHVSDAIRREVESLLRYDADSTAFIEEPAMNVAGRLMAAEISSADASLTGSTIGAFRILDKLGEGGMGVVYEAEDTRLRRKVALKFLPPQFAAHPRALERFEHEARAASALNHPHICTIYGVHDHDGRPFIEMERLEGETLKRRISKGALKESDAIAIMTALLDALAAAHDKGIVHRDLKPANIFLTPHGAKILDFGIAKLDASLEDGAVMGTRGYVAPEQLAGRDVDGRADLYSLGVILKEIATAPALVAVAGRACAEAADARYQSAREMRSAIEGIRTRAIRTRRGQIAAAIVVVIAGLSAFGARYLSDRLRDPFANLRQRQITHNASEFSIGSGAISADGRFIAYADPRGLHVIESASGESQPVEKMGTAATASGWDTTPGWLPDGSAIIANLHSASTESSSIWKIPMPAAPPSHLLDHARALAISPDAQWIAYSVEGDVRGERGVSIMHLDGSAQHKAFDAAPGTAIFDLTWSPDSTHVAYGVKNLATSEITLVTRSIDGGAPVTILEPRDPEALQGALWLRDGRLLYSLFQPAAGTSGGSTQCSHWQMRLTNDGRIAERAERLAGWLPQCVAGLSVTADGKRILYLQFGLQDTIRVVPMSGSDQSSRVTFTEGRNIPAAWTPAGGVVFMSDGNGRVGFYEQRPGGESPRLIISEPGIVGAARLAPDGETLLYLSLPSRGARETQIRRVPISGGSPEDVARGRFIDGIRCSNQGPPLCLVAESASAHRITFTQIDPNKGRGRIVLEIDAPRSTEYLWALSPNGDRIAILNIAEPVIRIIPIDGAPASEIRVPDAMTLGYISWRRDGLGVIVPRINADSASLLSVDLSGNSRVIWREPGAMDISGIPSPLSEDVAVWIRTRNASLWLAESP